MIDGDPTVNIADIRKINLVITQGHWLAPTEIYQRLGVKPFVQSVVEVKAIANAKTAENGSSGAGRTGMFH